MLTTSRAATATETYRADLDAMLGAARYRLRLATPLDDHEDLTSSGDAERRRTLDGSFETIVAAPVAAMEVTPARAR